MIYKKVQPCNLSKVEPFCGLGCDKMEIMKRYNPGEIEPKWQKIWDETGVYTADLQSKKPKYIAMSMFNYPSGAGIHIGHAMNYTISDVKARFKRQQGYESYHPVGWDAFGLPAENYAIKADVSPQESMGTIIPSYHKQYKAMGWSNDWEKEIATHLPEYYKWTQWIFSQMFKHKLAYQDARMQWWCEKCQTVLANEQVIEGKCWRHDGPDDSIVEKKEVKQWFFKITEYADELLEATDALDWTDSVKLAQKNWIGRSVGAEIIFKVCHPELDSGSSKKEIPDQVRNDNINITVFTTRPDTLFGATFMVVAPESELLASLVTKEQKEAVEEYAKEAAKKTEVERQAAKEKTGVFTGAYAINPVNNEEIPIWVADYVLAGYGTGAIMAVPAHDERDFEFAKKFNIPIKQVVEPLYVQATEPGKVREDKPFVERQAITAIVKHWSEEKYLGLKWKKVDWDTFLTGGVEKGQTAQEAAVQEIKEETGYLNPKLVKQLSNTHAQFFHVPKDENRFAHFSDFYFELEDGEREEVVQEEKQIHDIVWLTADEMETFRLPESHRFIWNELKDEQQIFTSEGLLANSGQYNGLSSSEAREKIVADLAKKGVAKEKVNYKMRDWSVSRQRYWGAPIPIVNCKKCGTVLIPDEDLPVVLPELEDFQPSGDGRSALARAKDWLEVECPDCGGKAERETDTLDTYICSSWYMLRYFDPRNQQKIFESDVANKWMPIDFYNGGDHATAHMLYARFVTRFFNKLGLIENPEPFKQFLFNGKVKAADGSAFSKSKGNGIDPLEIINQGYGADALRTYLMFAAPLEFDARWSAQGVPGTYRFLNRLWILVQEYNNPHSNEVPSTKKQYVPDELRRVTHAAVKKTTDDIEENRYNTAIATMMGLVNSLYKLKKEVPFTDLVWKESLEAAVSLVAPFAPHLAEELWQDLGHSSSVHKDTWPKFENKYLTTDLIKIVVQVNGKVRATIEVDAETSEEQVVAAAKQNEKVATYLSDNSVKKTIYVPKKLVNFVI